jgi:hypothetical protein
MTRSRLWWERDHITLTNLAVELTEIKDHPSRLFDRVVRHRSAAVRHPHLFERR